MKVRIAKKSGWGGLHRFCSLHAPGSPAEVVLPLEVRRHLLQLHHLLVGEQSRVQLDHPAASASAAVSRRGVVVLGDQHDLLHLVEVRHPHRRVKALLEHLAELEQLVGKNNFVTQKKYAFFFLVKPEVSRREPQIGG